MTRSHPGYAVAASALGAALLVSVRAPLWARLPAAGWLLGVLPGWLLGRALAGRTAVAPEEMAASALVGSIPVGMLLALAITWRPIGAAWPALGLGALFAIAAWLLPSPAGPPPRPDLRAWMVCIGAGLLAALPLCVNPVLRVYGDAMFHGQIVQEILTHGLPPQDPSFAGMPLAYSWPLHAWIAAIVRLADATPYAVFPWLAFTTTTGAAFVFLVFARRSGASAGAAAVSVMLTLFAMNALGWLQAALRIAHKLSLGPSRGEPGLHDRLVLLFGRPDAWEVASTLLFRGHYVLSSFLYKFACVNVVAPALTLAAAAYVAALAHLREGGWRLAFLAGLFTAAASLAHPVVGPSAAVALAVGLAGARLGTPGRSNAARTLLAVAAGGVAALAPLLVMLEAPIRAGAPTRLHPYPGNAVAIVQVLAVSAPLALLGWRRAFRLDRGAALLAAGYTIAAIGISSCVEFPSDAYAYPVYLAYMGTAWLFPHALAVIEDAGSSRPWLRRFARAALVPLPITTLILLQGFARHDARWGWAGYPQSPDERAVFDRLGTVPDTAVVLDTQNFQMSAAAAYSARRSLFGGMVQVRLVGYPAAEMRVREQAIRDLLYAPTTSEATWRFLASWRGPLYVVARSSPSGGRVFDAFEKPAGEPIAKLDALPDRLQPIVRTPTIALYRYRSPSDR